MDVHFQYGRGSRLVFTKLLLRPILPYTYSVGNMQACCHIIHSTICGMNHPQQLHLYEEEYLKLVRRSLTCATRRKSERKKQITTTYLCSNKLS